MTQTLEARNIRVCNATFALRQLLAQILGSRRSTVKVLAGQLQREGLIEHPRGRINIVNRAALESRACECYQVVHKTYDRLIGREYQLAP